MPRSTNPGKLLKATVPGPAGHLEFQGVDLAQAPVDVAVSKAGDLISTMAKHKPDRTYLVAGLIYGLVNVRTGGEKILCATLNEHSSSRDVRSVHSRF